MDHPPLLSPRTVPQHLLRRCLFPAVALISATSAIAQNVEIDPSAIEELPSIQASANEPFVKPQNTAADSTSNPETTLSEVLVYGEAESESVIQYPFMPPVEGTKIFAGKRTSVIDLDAFPEVQANNYRQALALTPGLLYEEETNPLVSIGYRGIGEPHRAQFFQVLKDGIPIHADPFGYPEAYFTPPLEVVDRIEFIRGGGSLMYGPQPAGALNYVTNMPRRDREFGFRTQNTFGTDNYFSTYTSIDGTSGKLGYLGYFNHRESDGFRSANSDYSIDAGHLKLVYTLSEATRWIFAVDIYEEEHGEPGGLTAAAMSANRDQITRQNDRFWLKRHVGSIEFQHSFSAQTEISIKTWGGYYGRTSRRQTGGGFGVPVPAAGTTSVQEQEFYTYGIEPRIRHDYSAWSGDHTFTGGAQFYIAHSPRTDKLGATPTSNDGILLRDTQRNTIYGSIFAENKFTFGRLSITPGFRLEMVNQDIVSQDFTTPAMIETNNSKLDIQPLVGLGIAYDLGHETELYANVSQSYRTTVFTQSLIPGVGGTASDADAALSWSYEIGYRGTPREWIAFDTAFFLIDLDDKYGAAGGLLTNVGRSINYGWDAALQVDIFGAFDACCNQTNLSRLGSLNLFTNVSLLEAEIDGGLADGNTPQFAPNYLLRTGAIYSFKDRCKVSFMGTIIDDHSNSDTAVANRFIPGYMVWDLTAEVKLCENLSLIAGLNNVFNEKYHARVRNDGIDPAYGRNFYVGASITY